jgi:hypothetical protein
MEEYVKAIYADDRDERVSTAVLADHLEVTAPTVSSTLKKLEEAGSGRPNALSARIYEMLLQAQRLLHFGGSAIHLHREPFVGRTNDSAACVLRASSDPEPPVSFRPVSGRPADRPMARVRHRLSSLVG